jgi:hypothetical protein
MVPLFDVRSHKCQLELYVLQPNKLFLTTLHGPIQFFWRKPSNIEKVRLKSTL